MIGWSEPQTGRATCKRRAIAPTFRSKATSSRSSRPRSLSAKPRTCSIGSSKQTGPKLLKSLEANVKAIEADKFTQDASFNLEKTRLERIRKNIKNCTLNAPADGVVVYANQSNAFGMVTAPIAEGVTVRQDQPIINLPDPLRMRVKARINESKLALVQTGQAARIVVDAFPEQPLKGRVRDVTAINTPLNASDVRVYYANVDIAQGFADLRPGLSAEVVFLVDSRRNVTRVPLDSIRWIHEHGYVAVYDPSSTNDKIRWRWKEVHLGLSNLQYAEILSGVEPGDRVVASPRELPPPEQLPASATRVAELSPKPRPAFTPGYSSRSRGREPRRLHAVALAYALASLPIGLERPLRASGFPWSHVSGVTRRLHAGLYDVAPCGAQTSVLWARVGGYPAFTRRVK